jgi:hypothetical protein
MVEGPSEIRIKLNSFLTLAVDGHLHAPAPVCLGKNISTSETGGWVDP